MKRNSHKYGAVRTELDGVTFASKAEARRYAELRLLEKAGEIEGLELQPKFPITVCGVKVCTYVSDFAYLPKGGLRRTVEDVKAAVTKTRIYRLKVKLVFAVYGITITEITRR